MDEYRTAGDEAAARARGQLEDEMNARVEAVRLLAVAAQQASDSAARAREAEGFHQAAYRSAIDAGWTEASLRKAGLRPPGTGATKRRNTRGTSTPSAVEE